MIRGKIGQVGNNESHKGADWIAPFPFGKTKA